jgi:hypothetical protein
MIPGHNSVLLLRNLPKQIRLECPQL